MKHPEEHKIARLRQASNRGFFVKEIIEGAVCEIGPTFGMASSLTINGDMANTCQPAPMSKILGEWMRQERKVSETAPFYLCRVSY